MQASSTNNTKDSAGRRLGVKKFGGEEVFPDDILRQRGFKHHPGKNTYVGKDHTIHAKVEGIVRFERIRLRKKNHYWVHVDPQENPNRTQKYPGPYVYLPELFPELAKKNPPPVEFIVPEKEQKPKKAEKEVCYTKVNDPSKRL